MANCQDIEPQLTAYVDGEVAAADRGRVESHLQRCPPCRARVASERATHELLLSHRDRLRVSAPEALRGRCAAHCRIAGGGRRFGRRMLVPLSLAATLVAAAAVLLVLGWSGSVETYAAQLADDHVKCFKYVPPPRTLDPTSLAAAWQTANGWPLKVAGSSPAEDLQLLDVRRCGSSEGHVAHLLYRWRGEPLSVYVLNGNVPAAADLDTHGPQPLAVLAEQAVVWRNRGRTYTVVARAPDADIERVVRYIRTVIE